MESACSCDAHVRFVHSHCLPTWILKSGFLQSLQLFFVLHFHIVLHTESQCVFICCSLCINGIASGTFEQKWWLTLLLCPFSHTGTDPEGPHVGGAAFRPSCGHPGGTPFDCTGTQQRQRDPVWVCFYFLHYYTILAVQNAVTTHCVWNRTEIWSLRLWICSFINKFGLTMLKMKENWTSSL